MRPTKTSTNHLHSAQGRIDGPELGLRMLLANEYRVLGASFKRVATVGLGRLALWVETSPRSVLDVGFLVNRSCEYKGCEETHCDEDRRELRVRKHGGSRANGGARSRVIRYEGSESGVEGLSGNEGRRESKEG